MSNEQDMIWELTSLDLGPGDLLLSFSCRASCHFLIFSGRSYPLSGSSSPYQLLHSFIVDGFVPEWLNLHIDGVIEQNLISCKAAQRSCSTDRQCSSLYSGSKLSLFDCFLAAAEDLTLFCLANSAVSSLSFLSRFPIARSSIHLNS